MKNKKIIILVLLIIILLGIIVSFYLIKQQKDKNIKKLLERQLVQEKMEIKSNYNTYVRTKNEIKLYNSQFKKIGIISKNTYITLDDEYKITDKYYKLKDLEYYVLYSDVEKTETEVLEKNEYLTYKNYIPFNENIITNENYKIYLSDNNFISLNKSNSYPIIIKDNEKYGIEFNDHLAYVNKEDIKEIIFTNNSQEQINEGIAVLNYHFTIDENSIERHECVQSICIPEIQVDEQIKYLNDNNFYSTTMRDLYLFLNGNIQLPKNSVSITIDDGWYVSRMIKILEKYEMIGTLFLIGSLANPSDYKSDFLEIHSHTWDMHTPKICRGAYGGGILCLNEEVILSDLNKSRESLNNTTVFCYPFYENNFRSKQLLQKAGFKMAFVGGGRKATQNDDLFLIPRYVMHDGLSINSFINYVS